MTAKKKTKRKGIPNPNPPVLVPDLVLPPEGKSDEKDKELDKEETTSEGPTKETSKSEGTGFRKADS